MKIEEQAESGKKIVVVERTNREEVLPDVPSALDFIMTVQNDYGAARIAVNKNVFTEDFFILSTGLAGEILQKCMNYRIKLAIYGDFSRYTSKPLRDFMYESNRGKDFFFVGTRQEAIQKLGAAE